MILLRMVLAVILPIVVCIDDLVFDRLHESDEFFKGNGAVRVGVYVLYEVTDLSGVSLQGAHYGLEVCHTNSVLPFFVK